jgi:hypothetical protein
VLPPGDGPSLLPATRKVPPAPRRPMRPYRIWSGGDSTRRARCAVPQAADGGLGSLKFKLGPRLGPPGLRPPASDRDGTHGSDGSPRECRPGWQASPGLGGRPATASRPRAGATLARRGQPGPSPLIGSGWGPRRPCGEARPGPGLCPFKADTRRGCRRALGSSAHCGQSAPASSPVAAPGPWALSQAGAAQRHQPAGPGPLAASLGPKPAPAGGTCSTPRPLRAAAACYLRLTDIGQGRIGTWGRGHRP